jgi:hypothetical protein
MDVNATNMSYAGKKEEGCTLCESNVGHTAFEHNALIEISASKAVNAMKPGGTVPTPKTLEEVIKGMDSVSLILELEGGESTILDRISTKGEMKALLEKVAPLRGSTGSYGRLCKQLEDAIAD